VTCSRKLLRFMKRCDPRGYAPCVASKSMAHATPASNVIRSFLFRSRSPCDSLAICCVCALVFSHGLFSFFFASQRDYCKDCYAECALNGRSLPRMPPEEQTF
jgi:hypothetical protein